MIKNYVQEVKAVQFDSKNPPMEWVERVYGKPADGGFSIDCYQIRETPDSTEGWKTFFKVKDDLAEYATELLEDGQWLVMSQSSGKIQVMYAPEFKWRYALVQPKGEGGGND